MDRPLPPPKNQFKMPVKVRKRPGPVEQARIQARIETDTAAFLEKGGEVLKCHIGETGKRY